MNEQSPIQVTDEINKLIKKNKEDAIVIAIDGRSASGKTTLAKFLSKQYDCNVFHMDDFFLQPSQRTEQRLAQIGGNVDYERFMQEVLSKVFKKETVIYRRYLCYKQMIAESEAIPYKPLTIIEGAYSMHPYFKNPYSLRIFMDIDSERQLEMIAKRNGVDMVDRFKTEWIPKENAYIEAFKIKEACDIYLKQE